MVSELIKNAQDFAGLSTDTKPLNVQNGSTFLETDTKAVFLFSGGTWNQL